MITGVCIQLLPGCPLYQQVASTAGYTGRAPLHFAQTWLQAPSIPSRFCSGSPVHQPHHGSLASGAVISIPSSREGDAGIRHLACGSQLCRFLAG